MSSTGDPLLFWFEFLSAFLVITVKQACNFSSFRQGFARVRSARPYRTRLNHESHNVKAHRRRSEPPIDRKCSPADRSDNSVAAILNANEIVVRVLGARSTAP